MIWKYKVELGMDLRWSGWSLHLPVYNGKVDAYVANTVYCLDTYTGNFIWKYETEANINYNLAISTAYGKVYVISRESLSNSQYTSHLYCLDANNGSVLWKRSYAGNSYSNIAIADGKIYFGVRKNFSV